MTLTRRLLYVLATSSAFERTARAIQPVENVAYGRAKRYVGGRALGEALRVSERLHDAGLATSLDFFGESETDPDALKRIVEVYREAARGLTTTSADIFLEIVPSHLGLDVDIETYVRNVQRIVEVLPPKTKLHISAEESWRTANIIETTLILAAAGAPVIQTLQANLVRSDSDAERLARENVPIRLVKGAYVEPRGIARPWGEETDVAYVRLAHQIHAAGTQIILGTHDPAIAESLLAALPGASVEMLLGVRESAAVALSKRGHHVRIYVPFGDEWFRYWMRRVAESRRS